MTAARARQFCQVMTTAAREGVNPPAAAAGAAIAGIEAAAFTVSSRSVGGVADGEAAWVWTASWLLLGWNGESGAA